MATIFCGGTRVNLVRTSTQVIAVSAGLAVILAGAPAPATPPMHRPTEPGTAEQPDPVRPGPALQTFELTPSGGSSPTGRAAHPDRRGPRRRPAPWPCRSGRRSRSACSAPPGRIRGRGCPGRSRYAPGRSPAGSGPVGQRWRATGAPPPSAAAPTTAAAAAPIRLWVGASDGVEARVAAADGRAAPLPAGLRLDLVNPDDAATPELSRSAGTAEIPQVEPDARTEAARVALPARPVPKMVTRSGWGANEAIVKNPPEYTDRRPGDVRAPHARAATATAAPTRPGSSAASRRTTYAATGGTTSATTSWSTSAATCSRAARAG